MQMMIRQIHLQGKITEELLQMHAGEDMFGHEKDPEKKVMFCDASLPVRSWIVW